jgi:hypothetical protein
MKKLLASIVAFSALASLAGVAHADVTHLTSRGGVTSELMRLEQAGYNPAHKSNDYPNDIQAAEAKIHAQDAMAANGASRDTSGYGYVPAGTSQGGTVAHLGDRDGLYTHH